MAEPTRLLVELRPGADRGLAARRTNLRPLFERAPAAELGVAAEPRWYVADLPAEAPSPWDAAHSRLAAAMGLAPEDLVYAEPDLPQRFLTANEVGGGDQPFAIGTGCQPDGQTTKGGRVAGPGFGWHLGDAFTRLARARAAVTFSEPRTRIAHIDTGYDPSHLSRPANVLRDLEHNFVRADGQPNDASDPNRRHLLDQSGHGTGTLSILAGAAVPASGGQPLGGAPDAAVVPLRIANSVILFWTSVFARALDYATTHQCDVVSISMGGLPSRAWNDAVARAYEAGVCIVAASGDCLPGGVPTHNVVYPARYRRVIAACGVMADGAPYYHLTTGIQGSWGPASAMTAAVSAYSPNIPWARIGCAETVDEDGEGTSASTPQIAAAVALWYERYKPLLPRDWRRVEAVRHALFASAVAPSAKRAKYLGRGILDAEAALAVTPLLNLPKTPRDADSFAFLRVITGLGVAAATARQRMFDLELTQRWLVNPALQEAVPDPEAEVSREALRVFLDAAIADEGASQRLRRHLMERYALVFAGAAVPVPASLAPLPPPPLASMPLPAPPARRLRVYAVDPSLTTRLATAEVGEAVLHVRWEALEPGPVGEYVEVCEEEPLAGGAAVEAVDLDHPFLLAQDGLAPAEGDPRFHQQMVYAVAMSTIGHFERALGRPVLWRPRINPEKEADDSQFVRRLRIRPHALRQANAFYSPHEVGLLFGSFEAGADDLGDQVPGSEVYTCLSHDIVAHETTHAILDGLHRRFNEPTNRDTLALHEGFADLVALLQHFTLPEILAAEIRRTRGDLRAESLLGQLAVQFGRAISGRGALRSAIGRLDEKGRWQRLEPDPAAYRTVESPHARGAILVAAVFDAYLAIYESRTVDLLRLATGGTGVLPDGAIHPDLVTRLAAEAAKTAGHVLGLVIRAVDYLPAVDVTFGEFLRGLITADFDLVPEDRYGYRVAFVEAFRRRGIHPEGVRTLSVDTLRWSGIRLSKGSRRLTGLVKSLQTYADDCQYLPSRERLFRRSRKERFKLHARLSELFAEDRRFADELGLDPERSFEVHAVQAASRRRPDGPEVPQVIVALTQSRRIEVPGVAEPRVFRGGSTLVVDLVGSAIQYAIVKDVRSAAREARTREYLAAALADPLRALLMEPGREPFSALHALADVG